MLRSQVVSLYVRLLKLAIGYHAFALFSTHFVLTAEDTPVMDYLVKYGYLPPSDPNSNQLRSGDGIEQAIKDLQFMGGLNETGLIDSQTMKLIQTPRCGVPDNVSLLRAHNAAAAAAAKLSLRHPASAAAHATVRRRLRRFVQTDRRWSKNILTWTVTDYTKSLSQSDTRRVLKAAFDAWSPHVPIKFQETAADPSTNSVHADIRIKFGKRDHGDPFPFDGTGRTLAHAFLPGPADMDGDVHFDDDEKWVTRSSLAGTSLLFTAIHELGHSLGLLHTNIPDAIMWSSYKKPQTDDIMLHTDDIDGIVSMYGGRGNVRWTAASLPAPPPTLMSPIKMVTPQRHVTPKNLPMSVRPTSTLPPAADIPWQCKTKFDSVTIIRQETMSFKGKSMWRTRKNGTPAYQRAINTESFFIGLPPATSWTNVDEVFELSNNDIVFFIGKQYFLFNGRRLKHDFPAQGKPITDFGLPGSLDKIDAMFRWGWNGGTYIVSGEMYWQFNETAKQVLPDYPRGMSVWKGVQLPVDAAIQSYNGKTYFFSGLEYWEFDDKRMSVAAGFPKLANTDWLGCPPPPGGHVGSL